MDNCGCSSQKLIHVNSIDQKLHEVIFTSLINDTILISRIEIIKRNKETTLSAGGSDTLIFAQKPSMLADGFRLGSKIILRHIFLFSCTQKQRLRALALWRSDDFPPPRNNLQS
jgi:hypothetical protein